MAKDFSILAMSSSYDDPDLLLVRAIAEGEVEALNQLYARYGSPLLIYLVSRIGDRSLAEEVLQDVMMAVWRGAANFRANSSVKTWLLAIARHHAINASSRRNRATLSMPDEADLALTEAGPEQHIEHNLLSDELQTALQQLPPEQRETMELLFWQDLSQAEIAQVLRVAPGTVKSRLSRAKATLRKVLKTKERDF